MGNSNQNYVVALGRQFGSGGREIGQLVAQGLHIDYYDKELLEEAAKSSGVNKDFFEAADERSPNFFSGLWSFLPSGYNTSAYYMVGSMPLSDDNIYRAQSDVIRGLANRGSCVIVGRTADYILRNHCKVISVFVHAALADCTARILARGEANGEKEAQSMAEHQNKLRAEYYNFYTDRRWGDAASYDLCLNASLLGTQAAADVICTFVKKAIDSKK